MAYKPGTTGTPQHFLECENEDCDKNCEFYCNTCHLRLCERCRDEHLRNLETKDHELVLYQRRKRNLPKERCKIHPGRKIDLLCEECKKPLCSKCTTTQEHRGHTFGDLETIYENKVSFCKEEIARIRKYYLPTSQELKKNVQEDASEIKLNVDNIITSIKSDGESLKNIVDTLVSENVEYVKKLGQSATETLNNQDKILDDYITYLHDRVKEFHGYLSTTNPMKLISNFYEEETNISPIPETTKPITPIFTPGEKRKGAVAKVLGKVIVPLAKAETKKMKSMEISSLSFDFSIIKVREFIVPNIEKACHISHQSDRLWASDQFGNLVQTDLQGNLLQKIKTCNQYYGYHTVTQDGDLIFTDKDKGVVKKMTLDDNFIEFIQPEDWMPLSIHSSHVNGDILVGMKKSIEGKVTRYNKTGKELQNIESDNDGQILYGFPHFITENTNGDICASDWNKKEVVVVKKSGQHRFSYRGQGSDFRPFGICTDVLGHILVCDAFSESVHLIDQDGQLLSLLLSQKQGIQHSHSVVVDGDNNLYLGEYSNDIIKVFKYLQ